MWLHCLSQHTSPINLPQEMGGSPVPARTLPENGSPINDAIFAARTVPKSAPMKLLPENGSQKVVAWLVLSKQRFPADGRISGASAHSARKWFPENGVVFGASPHAAKKGSLEAVPFSGQGALCQKMAPTKWSHFLLQHTLSQTTVPRIWADF